MKIGLGITTYNRDYLIEPLVKSLITTTPDDTIIIFSDDGSTDNTLSNLEMLKMPYISSSTKNIALNKNRALKYLYDNNCDYYFLIDDDLLPQHNNWMNYYIEAMTKTPIKHILWSPPLWSKVVREDIHSDIKISRVDWPTGAFMCMTNDVVSSVGAFSYDMKRYGLEHVDWTRRAARAGFTGEPYGTYPHLKGSDEWFNYNSTYIPESETNIGVLEQEGDNNNKMDYAMYNLNIMQQHESSGLIYIPFQELHNDKEYFII